MLYSQMHVLRITPLFAQVEGEPMGSAIYMLNFSSWYAAIPTLTAFSILEKEG